MSKKRAVVNPDTGPTPPGYNKLLRQSARGALAASSCFLLLGNPSVAVVFAVALSCFPGLSTSLRSSTWGLGRRGHEQQQQQY